MIQQILNQKISLMWELISCNLPCIAFVRYLKKKDWFANIDVFFLPILDREEPGKCFVFGLTILIHAVNSVD